MVHRIKALIYVAVRVLCAQYAAAKLVVSALLRAKMQSRRPIRYPVPRVVKSNAVDADAAADPRKQAPLAAVSVSSAPFVALSRPFVNTIVTACTLVVLLRALLSTGVRLASIVEDGSRNA